jgi:hypothetical protein
MREIYELSSKLRSAVQDEERSRKVAGKLGMAVCGAHGGEGKRPGSLMQRPSCRLPTPKSSGSWGLLWGTETELWLVPQWWPASLDIPAGPLTLKIAVTPHRITLSREMIPPTSPTVQETQSWQGNSGSVLGSSTTACVSCKLGLSERWRR